MVDDDARTWRDIADQLSPEQCARLEQFESEMLAHAEPDEIATRLLGLARHYSESDLVRSLVDVGDAEFADGEGYIARDEFVVHAAGTTRMVDDVGVGDAFIDEDHDDDLDEPRVASVAVEVQIHSHRYGDGTTYRNIVLTPHAYDCEPDVPDGYTPVTSLDEASLTVDGALRLAAALIEAAEEINELQHTKAS